MIGDLTIGDTTISDLTIGDITVSDPMIGNTTNFGMESTQAKCLPSRQFMTFWRFRHGMGHTQQLKHKLHKCWLVSTCDYNRGHMNCITISWWFERSKN